MTVDFPDTYSDAATTTRVPGEVAAPKFLDRREIVS